MYAQPWELAIDAGAEFLEDVDLDVEIAGGVDIAAQTLVGALSIPPAVVPTNLDVARVTPLRSADDLLVEWEPTGDPRDSVLISVEDSFGGDVWHVEDTDGSFVIDGEILRRAQGEFIFGVTLTRLRDQEATLLSGDFVTVRGASLQALELDFVGAWGIEPSRWEVGETLTVEVASYDGPLDPNTAFLDAGPGIVVGSFSPADTTGNRLLVDVTVERGAETGMRTVTLGDASLTIEATRAVSVVRELPHAGICEEALVEGPVDDGAWLANDGGLSTGVWGTHTCFVDPTGNAQPIPISLERGEFLEARLVHDSPFPGVLYLTDGCDGGDAEVCVVESVSKQFDAVLRYEALETEDRLLVVSSDAFADLGPHDYVVDVQRTGPHPFVLVPNEAEDGQDVDLTAHCTSEPCAWDVHTPTFDFGPSITVAGVTVLDAETATVSIESTTVYDTALPLDVSVTADGITRTTPGAFTLIQLHYADTCLAADLEPLAFGPGRYRGFTTDFDTQEAAIDPRPCLANEGFGSHSILRFEVPPSQTIRASLDFPGVDGMLYLMDACPGVTVACGDRGDENVLEGLSWTAPPEGATVYLVVDANFEDDVGNYALEVEMTP